MIKGQAKVMKLAPGGLTGIPIRLLILHPVPAKAVETSSEDKDHG